MNTLTWPGSGARNALVTNSQEVAGAAYRLNAPPDHPLVLDLDRTLIKTDLLFETFAAALHKNPFIIFLCAWWLLKGRATLKRELARRAVLDLDVIPVNEAVASLARAEAARGRRVVLATSADELLARRIARRFEFISNVFASDGRENLSGEAKAAMLAQTFPQGFVYAGDSASDLHIWQAASCAVLVPVHPFVKARVKKLGRPMLVVGDSGFSLITAFRALRVKQWAKNLLVFAPVLLSGLYAEASAWMQAGIAFLALGLVASAAYVVNDAFDLSDDRRHWSKKMRPLAAGDMRIEFAAVLIPALMLAGLALAFVAGPLVLASVVAYAAATLAYSLALKRMAVIDVVALAGLFTLRLLLGAAAISAPVSPWLVMFSMALFLSLSVAKRHTEVIRMVANGRSLAAGRGYAARDEAFLLALGMGAAFSSVLLCSLYLTQVAAHAAFYSAPHFLWLAPCVLLLWLGRIWLKSQHGELDDDPVAFALRDPASLWLGGLMIAGYLLAAFGGQLVP